MYEVELFNKFSSGFYKMSVRTDRQCRLRSNRTDCTVIKMAVSSP